MSGVQAFCVSKTLAKGGFISPELNKISGLPKRAPPVLGRAPSEVTQKQLDELHIAVTEHEEE